MRRVLQQAGVVPWRRGVSGLEVLLITSQRTGQWGVPKGMIEAL